MSGDNMDKNKVYLCASANWTTGYFVIHMANSWHIVEWSCGEAEVLPVYHDSYAVSDRWALTATRPCKEYPVYQEYEYVN